jgi:hypothetical protein
LKAREGTRKEASVWRRADLVRSSDSVPSRPTATNSTNRTDAISLYLAAWRTILQLVATTQPRFRGWTGCCRQGLPQAHADLRPSSRFRSSTRPSNPSSPHHRYTQAHSSSYTTTSRSVSLSLYLAIRLVRADPTVSRGFVAHSPEMALGHARYARLA